LKVTKEIAASLESGCYEVLSDLQGERQRLYGALQVEEGTGDFEEAANLIGEIIALEERSAALARARYEALGREMGRVGRAKKINNAYGRQVLA